MKKLEKLSLNTLSKRMQMIADTYFAARKYENQVPKMYDAEAGKPINQYTIYIERVEKTYEKLDTLEQIFINNEYFFQNYKDWWRKAYSKKMYNFYLKKTLVRFLGVFFNEA